MNRLAADRLIAAGWPEADVERVLARTQFRRAIQDAILRYSHAVGVSDTDTPDERRADRRCIPCGVVFDSAHAGNRMCPGCLSRAGRVSPLAPAGAAPLAELAGPDERMVGAS